MAISKELGFQECMRLLHTAAIGRVALATPEGSHIIPVNYSIVDEAVAWPPRPAPGSAVPGTSTFGFLAANCPAAASA